MKINGADITVGMKLKLEFFGKLLPAKVTMVLKGPKILNNPSKIYIEYLLEDETKFNDPIGCFVSSDKLYEKI